MQRHEPREHTAMAKLRHIVICVADLQGAADFYERR